MITEPLPFFKLKNISFFNENEIGYYLGKMQMREESAQGIVIRLMENVNNRHFNANSIGFQLSFLI